MSTVTTEIIPGGSRTPAGGTCVPCNTGRVTVHTQLLAVCWDTGDDGLEAEDSPLGEVQVRLVPTGGGEAVAGTSGSGPEDEGGDGETLGELELRNVVPGEYEVRASRSGFKAPRTAPTVTVEAAGSAEVEVVLMRRGLECNRKHPNAPGINDGPFIWLPIAWLPWNEPAVLVIRDVLWFAALGFVIAGLATLDLSMTALSSLMLGTFSGMIFGRWLGIPSLLAAFVAFVLLIVAAASSAALEALGIAVPQPVPAGGAAGGWAAFLLALCIGRVNTYTLGSMQEFALGSCGVGGVVGLVVSLFMSNYDPLATVFGALLGALWGAVAGIFGHAFTNEGQAAAEHWKEGGFRLPYAGTRYCVQAPRGFISHFGEEEHSYDWAVPEGEPVLAALEGHVISYREDQEGTEAFSGNSTANLVVVRHRDGSTAHYLHGKKGGVTAVNPDLEPESRAGSTRRMRTPVYVQQGQHLCRAGNVGRSMFSHIHFMVRPARTDPTNPGESGRYIPVRFDDPDTDDGRCWSMRRTLSENVNVGAIRFPPIETSGYPRG